MGEEINVYRVLAGKSEERRSLGTPKNRSEDGIRMDLREIAWECVEWIQLFRDGDRLRTIVTTVMNF
jgi:hypothetical protein